MNMRTQDWVESVLFETSPGVLIVDAANTLLFHNEPGLLVLRQPVPDTVTLAEALVGEFSSLANLCDEARKRNEPRTTFFSLYDEDEDAWTYWHASATPRQKDDEAVMVIRIRDVTASYASVMDMILEEKMSAVGLLAAGVSHEFNNIWASVYGYAELALHDERFTRDLIDTVLEQSNRTMEILHALLSFSHQERSLQQRIRLGDILHSVMRLAEVELRSKGIESQLEVRDNPEVFGNPGMLQQVMLNLVMNAYQSIQDKGRVTVTVNTDGYKAIVEVADTGSGMPKEKIKSLFDPFYTTKGAFGGNPVVDGRGLGLTLAYNFIRMHKGRIRVSSKPGEGSVFTVELSLASSRETEMVQRKEAIARGELHEGSLNVLIVEDELPLVGLLESILDEHSHTHRATVNGQDAIDMIMEEPFDLVLLDLVLKDDVHGTTVARKIAELSPATKIYIMTAHSEDKRIQEIQPLVAGVLSKPFHLKEISQTLEHVKRKFQFPESS